MSRDLSPEEREHAIALHKRYRREGRVDIESLLVAELSKPGLRTVSRFQVSRCIADWKEELALPIDVREDVELHARALPAPRRSLRTRRRRARSCRAAV